MMVCSCPSPDDAICALQLMAEGWLVFAALAVFATFAALLAILLIQLHFTVR